MRKPQVDAILDREAEEHWHAWWASVNAMLDRLASKRRADAEQRRELAEAKQSAARPRLALDRMTVNDDPLAGGEK